MAGSEGAAARPAGRTLDAKLGRIRAGRYTPADFVIADAKDGDMAFGVTAPGPRGLGGADGRGGRDGSGDADGTSAWKPRAAHLDAIGEMTASGLVDIMLLSLSSAERLTGEGRFEGSALTPAVRLNDTTDIWNARGSHYRESPSRPFASADLASAAEVCDLGLYSMTFHDDLDSDLRSLEAYRAFRLALRERPMRHFLEVFNPAFDIGIAEADLGHYINDMIIKALAGVTAADQPLFLKMQFNGARAMAELAAYDPAHLIVGILGGSKGTTRDTFELIAQAEAAGARVALFGRKINLAEAPIELVRLMRDTVEGRETPESAVREYHRRLEARGMRPERALADDLQVTEPALRRNGSA